MSKTLCKVVIHLRSGHRRVVQADADTHERALAFSYPPERAPVFFVHCAPTVNYRQPHYRRTNDRRAWSTRTASPR